MVVFFFSKNLKAQNLAFKSGDGEALRTVRANLNRLRLAKRAHSQIIQDFFHDSANIRNMWQDIRTITNYWTVPPASEDDMDFLNK